MLSKGILNKRESLSILLLFLCCPALLATNFSILYFFLLTILLFINQKTILESIFTFFKFKKPAEIIIIFWFFSSFFSIFVDINSIDFIPFLGKIIFVFLTYVSFESYLKCFPENNKNQICFYELFKLYRNLLYVASFFAIIQIFFGFQIFREGQLRAEGLSRFATPLGAGLTVYGLLGCIFFILIIINNQRDVVYLSDYIITFVSLFISAQKISFGFIFLMIIFVASRPLLRIPILFAKPYLSKKLIYSSIIFLFFLTIFITVFLPVIYPYFDSLINLIRAVFNQPFESGDSFSQSIWQGTGSIPWRIYQIGIELFSHCLNNYPFRFLFFGCSPYELGREYGYLSGFQAHNGIFSIFLRIGLLPSSIVIYAIISNRIRLSFPFILFLLLMSLNGGFLVSPSISLALFIFLNYDTSVSYKNNKLVHNNKL